MDAKATFSALCFLLVLALAGCMSVDDEIQGNKERAREVILAIEAFQQEHGRFPESLDDLVPDYTDEIPKTVTGSNFIYYAINENQNDPGYFVIGFDLASRSNMGCGYSSRDESWECGFGG